MDAQIFSLPLPKPGEGKRGEDGYLSYLLRQAAGAHRLRVERALAELNVTPPQYWVLTMLAAYPGHSNADLARVALLTPQTVSVIVKNLLRAGAITRRKHAVHGRIQQLELTDSGQSLLAACRERSLAINQDLGDALSDAEREVVKRWLIGIATGVIE